MGTIVSLVRERPRSRRSADGATRGAQILFFTGVRYCREDDAPTPMPEARIVRDLTTRLPESALALDLAAH